MPQNSLSKVRRIVWAVDALEAPGTLQRNAIQALRGFSKGAAGIVEIEPVYSVHLPPEIADLPFAWARQYMEGVEDSLKSIVKKADVPGLRAPRILGDFPTNRIDDPVDRLCEYAEKANADLIVCNTHSKRGLRRLFLGSFAEALILRSRVPVLSVGPHLRRNTSTIDSILVPSDLESSSFGAFQRAVALAQQFNAQIELYHAVQFPVQPYASGNVFFPTNYWRAVNDYIEGDRKKSEEVMERWTSWAAARGVKVKCLINEREGGIAADIAKVAEKRGVSMIAMESQSGPVASFLLGSIARQVVRHSNCPVVILRSRHAEAKAKSLRARQRSAA